MERLNSRLQKLKSKKGFTLIELLAVIAIIAILVLIAAPSFLGSKEKATLAAVKADIKTAELSVGRHLLDHETLAKQTVNGKEVGFDKYTPESGKDYYSNKGKLDTPPTGGDLYDISKIIDSKVLDKGDLVASDNGKVYFVTDEVKLEPNPESDFTWVPHYEYGYKFGTKGTGYWHYKGDSTEVVIPEKIEGVVLTSYYRMFHGTSVTKVTSTNKNVTNMSFMFYQSQASSLDLSNFNTSKVSDMSEMFFRSQATSLNLNSFNTSSVTDMYRMFYESQASSLDLSNFNTANVTNMGSMFTRSKATSLNLSSFDTSKVTDMNWMFQNSKATKGIARTQEDADKFNNSSMKPENLKFTVKQ